jgi:hypothetical protein
VIGIIVLITLFFGRHMRKEKLNNCIEDLLPENYPSVLQVRSDLEWSITDDVRLFAGIDLLGAPDVSFFGPSRENNRFQSRLKYSF